MNASELMIGNWVMYSSAIEVNAEKILECVKHPERFQPIEITEKWLLHLGFISEEDEDGTEYFKQYPWQNWGMFIRYSNEQKEWVVFQGFGDSTRDHLTQVKHLHKLQNLYHAVLGEGLRIEWPFSEN